MLVSKPCWSEVAEEAFTLLDWVIKGFNFINKVRQLKTEAVETLQYSAMFRIES